MCVGIAFPPKVEEKRHKRVKKTEEEGGEREKKKDALQPLMGTFGKVDKEEAVQKLSWATLDDERLVKYFLRSIQQSRYQITNNHIHLVTCCT